jgi:hypothetical protein
VNRRGFLRTSVSGAAALALAGAPGFIRRAFADSSCAPQPRARLASLAGAYRRAQRAGTPLLVLIVPEDVDAQWDRGMAWGELLNHGTDAQLAPLARVEVACASMRDVVELAPSAAGREPLAMAIDTAGSPAQVTRIDGNLPQYPSDFRRGDWQEITRVEAGITSARIELIARLLRDALAPNGDAGDAAVLAQSVRARLTDHPPVGARWARSSGCGTIVEGQNDNSVFGCGMGHVPEKSQRFLAFFATGAVR